MLMTFWLMVASLLFGGADYDEDVVLLEAYPLDEPLFVQGLEIDDSGRLLLSTGLYGDSRTGYLNVDDGTFDAIEQLDDTYFGEGITITPEGILQLTWKKETMFVRDLDSLEVSDTVSYHGEGWGLAFDDADGVWMSNGGNSVVLRDLESFEVVDEILTEYDNINELEYVDGFLYANIWLTYDVIKIDVASGEVVKVYDLEPIVYSIEMNDDEIRQMDTLNGIAHIDGDEFYLAGKNYPYLYKVRFE